jgi:hypothetical protein
MRHILEAAGVKDVVGKSLGSANAINTTWATLRALSELRSPGEMARLRGVEDESLTGQRNGGNGRTAETDEPLDAVAAAPTALAEANNAE